MLTSVWFGPTLRDVRMWVEATRPVAFARCATSWRRLPVRGRRGSSRAGGLCSPVPARGSSSRACGRGGPNPATRTPPALSSSPRRKHWPVESTIANITPSMKRPWPPNMPLDVMWPHGWRSSCRAAAACVRLCPSWLPCLPWCAPSMGWRTCPHLTTSSARAASLRPDRPYDPDRDSLPTAQGVPGRLLARLAAIGAASPIAPTPWPFSVSARSVRTRPPRRALGPRLLRRRGAGREAALPRRPRVAHGRAARSRSASRTRSTAGRSCSWTASTPSTRSSSPTSWRRSRRRRPVSCGAGTTRTGPATAPGPVGTPTRRPRLPRERGPDQRARRAPP